jgi:uncharacterized lipoprotein YajG
MSLSFRLGLLASFFVAGCLTGCAFTTARVDLTYKPDPAKKSPVSTVQGRAIAIQVHDERDPKERDRVGNKINNFGMATARVESKEDVALAVAKALRGELENGGHKVVAIQGGPSSVPPELTVQVALKRYWSEAKIRFWDVEMLATINSLVSLASASGQTIVSKPIHCTYREGAAIAVDSAFGKVLNGVLAEYVRTFAYDSEVLKALEAPATAP